MDLVALQQLPGCPDERTQVLLFFLMTDNDVGRSGPLCIIKQQQDENEDEDERGRYKSGAHVLAETETMLERSYRSGAQEELLLLLN